MTPRSAGEIRWSNYLKVYAEFYRERPEKVKDVAARYPGYPVDRWRNLFKNAHS